MDFSLITYHVMLPMLEYFRHVFGSYGWAIILVTLVIKLALTPLSLKQLESSRKMQGKMSKIKPEMDRIQEKFKQRKKKYEHDPAKLEEVQKEFQEQITTLYRESGALNPLGGCLPTLLQFPLLIALYWSFSGPPFQPSMLHVPMQASSEVSTKDSLHLRPLRSQTVNFVDKDGKLSRLRLESDIPEKLLVGETYNLYLKQVHGKGELPASGINWNLLAKGQNPNVASQPSKANTSWTNGVIELNIPDSNANKATIKALKPTEKFSLQVLIPELRGHQSFFFIKDLGRLGMWNKETKEIHWDIVVLVLLMGASFWLSNKFMTASTPQPPSLDNDTSQQDMQKQMQTMMPIMFLGMMAFFPIPAGVFIYFIVSNIIQLAQTIAVQKFIPLPEVQAEPEKVKALS